MIAVKVNPAASRKGLAAAERYGVQSFPAIYFVDAGGRVLLSVSGFLPPDEFAEEMAQALSRAPRPVR